MKLLKKYVVLLVLLLASSIVLADPLVVYSARKEHLIKPLFDVYTKNTGVEIQYITDKAGPLLARMKAEGQNTRADILMTVDAGNLWYAAEQGVLAPISSSKLEANVPAHLRDDLGRWFGLSVRARTIVYSTDRVKPGELSSYQALAEPQWKGRLCLRTSKKIYNQSLVAMMVERLGEAEAEKTVRGWVDNLAVPPFSNDTKTMQAIADGQCDVGIVNTYYFGRLQKKTPGIKLALYWPDQQAKGVHINISGAGISKYSKQKQQAQQLLEWLSSPEAQQIFAGLNMEYPVNPAVDADAVVTAWGDFKADDTPITIAGQRQAQAVMLMDRAGYR